MNATTLGLYGVIGAFCIQVIVAIVRAPSESNRALQLVMLLLKVALAGILTSIYFRFADGPSPNHWMVMHYGLFVALILQEIEDVASSSKTGTGMPLPISCFIAASTPALILNGFPAVFAVGAFGAMTAEVWTFQKERRKHIEVPKSYWIIACLLVLCGGGVTTLHGIENVSALVAFQLGASPPLVYKQVRR